MQSGDTLALTWDWNEERVLAVSDFYHLPRVKMAFQRQGLDVYTVPARGTPPLAIPYNLLRETAAFWAYYLRHLD